MIPVDGGKKYQSDRRSTAHTRDSGYIIILTILIRLYNIKLCRDRKHSVVKYKQDVYKIVIFYFDSEDSGCRC